LTPLSSISIILLAAGGSTRLGRPKQLVQIGTRSLIRRAADTALGSRAKEVIVVIGASAERIRAELKDLPLSVIENSKWQEGISSSIKAGLEVLSPQSEGALFLLCDQPYVSSDLLNQLIDCFEPSETPLIACEYGETVGIPALFSRSLFPDLKRLTGDVGAKSIIRARPETTKTIPFPRGDVDIDTIDDLENLDARFQT